VIGSMSLAELRRHLRSLGIERLVIEQGGQFDAVRVDAHLTRSATEVLALSSDREHGPGHTTLDEAVEIVLAQAAKMRAEERKGAKP